MLVAPKLNGATLVHTGSQLVALKLVDVCTT